MVNNEDRDWFKNLLFDKMKQDFQVSQMVNDEVINWFKNLLFKK